MDTQIRNTLSKHIYAAFNEWYKNNESFREYIITNNAKNYWDMINNEDLEECCKYWNCKSYAGQTKAVFNFFDYDYVFKIPFGVKNNRIIHTPCESKDYCALEVEFYKAALEEGLEEIFAEAEYLTSFCGTPIYVMRKAEVDENQVYDDSYNSYARFSGINLKQLTDRELDDFYYEAEEACADCCAVVDYALGEYYDNDFLDKLSAFKRKYQINDIHEANVGYINGKLVIIDYSGY